MSNYLFIGGPAHGQEICILHGNSVVFAESNAGTRTKYQRQTFIFGDDRLEVFVLEGMPAEDAAAMLSEIINQRARREYDSRQWKRLVLAGTSDDAGETLLMGRKLKDLTDSEARAALFWFVSNAQHLTLHAKDPRA